MLFVSSRHINNNVRLFRTALHWAAKRNQKPIIEILLQHGADKNIQTNDGKLAEDLSSNDEIAKLFGKEGEIVAFASSISTAPYSEIRIITNLVLFPSISRDDNHGLPLETTQFKSHIKKLKVICFIYLLLIYHDCDRSKRIFEV